MLAWFIDTHPVPSEHKELFSNEMTNIFYDLNNKKSESCILGDLNINLFQLKFKPQIQSYAKTLIGSAVKCLTDQPTRIQNKSKTLIDHIYSNNLNHQIFSGILVSDLLNLFNSINRCMIRLW